MLKCFISCFHLINSIFSSCNKHTHNHTWASTQIDILVTFPWKNTFILTTLKYSVWSRTWASQNPEEYILKRTCSKTQTTQAWMVQNRIAQLWELRIAISTSKLFISIVSVLPPDSFSLWFISSGLFSSFALFF